MTLPSGRFAVEILGGLYPSCDGTECDGLSRKRSDDGDRHRYYADGNRKAYSGSLNDEQGATADDQRQQHISAESKHTETADRHGLVSNGYSRISEIVRSTRRELETILTNAQTKIDAIEKSKMPAAIKVVQIASEVQTARAWATHKSALAVSDISN